MWKEHHIILGLQTPAGAIQSEFYLQERCRAPELASHHRAFVAVKGDFLAQLLKPESRLPGITKLALLICSLSTTAKCGSPPGRGGIMARPQGRLCCRRGDMGRAVAGAGHYGVGFPLPFVGKMKSPAGNRILARGGRAVNLKGPGCRKSCSRSDAVTALKLSSRWDFFMCCFFSHFFFFFFLQSACLDPLIVIWLVL